VIETTDADGRTVTYSYNQLGDQTGQSLLNAAGEAIEITTFTYDSDGEMTGADNPSATETFTYDNGGNLKTEATSGPGTGQPTLTLTYSYYPSGQLESISDSLSGSGDTGQGITTYVYNDAQELTTITQSIGGTAGPEVTMTYDPASLLTATTRSIAGTGDDLASLDSYDSAENLTSISAQFGSVSSSPAMPSTIIGPGNVKLVNDDDQAYNSAGQVTGTTFQLGQSSESNSYTYDADGQLLSSSGASDDSYGYDPNGNRDTTGYTVGTGNELTNSPGVTYTYENDGNMLTETTSSGTTTYTYDYQNQLTNVEANGVMVATYTYNALGQRIGIKDNGTQTWTVYNGNSADANPYADFSSSGSLQTRYLDGLAVDQIFGQTSSSGSTEWYLTDQLGSVVAIASTSAVLDQITYDPFGNIVTQTNATDAVRFGFAGMEYDSATGLYYDHARYYDAAIGRFTSQDPKGFAAGDTNLYRYVGNDPTAAADPTGMAPPLRNPLLGVLQQPVGVVTGGIGAVTGSIYPIQTFQRGKKITQPVAIIYPTTFHSTLPRPGGKPAPPPSPISGPVPPGDFPPTYNQNTFYSQVYRVHITIYDPNPTRINP
jgi:RHS repeat-associated protein